MPSLVGSEMCIRDSADTQGFLSGQQVAGGEQAQGQGGKEMAFLHEGVLASCCWFGKSEEKRAATILYL